jgi:plasmid stabilization system protein ParE
MSLPVVLRAEAQADFDEAFDWYEGQRPGLGVDFAAQVQDVFDRISNTPLLHSTVFQDVRKALVQRFPYSIFYRAEASQVLILAVFHAKRDPSIWQARA